MTELEHYIQAHFEIVPQNELIEISTLFNEITLKKGDYFLNEGQVCNKFAFIKSGYLRIFANEDGQEVTQWIAPQGYFGTDFASFFFNRPSKWNIQALETSVAYIINKENYNKISNIIPNWIELERSFLIKCMTLMETRIYNHLSKSAEERYTMFFENNKALFNQIPLQYIASMLGMTPETFSRIRKKRNP